MPGGHVGGWVEGEGPPVLLLHGGPGLSFDHMEPVAVELRPGWRVASYQQRGLAPSTEAGPFSVEREIDDAVTVLDELGWQRAWVVGHSWGGHLLLHLARAVPERLHGGLAVDPLGGLGDGGSAAFEAEMLARLAPAARARLQELDERAMAGTGTEEEAVESVRLAWPAYFASPDDTLPFVAQRMSVPAYAGLWDSLVEELPRLEASLSAIQVPLGFLAGERSPMPHELAAGATAAAVPGAQLEVLADAGHYPWHERPGCVGAALRRLVQHAAR
ncbi:MAG TPA: alpha/beta hydrolase [Solirubrobacteraceae bacterium]|nr:alpha/beta hydrolase [Solirubrobacteraceae bacterium]